MECLYSLPLMNPKLIIRKKLTEKEEKVKRLLPINLKILILLSTKFS